LGLAIGDALGAPLEGLSPQQIRSHYQSVTEYVDGVKAWKRKPFRWRVKGLYTDDTQQAQAICDILLANGQIDLDQLAKLYLDLATPDRGYAGSHRGVGKSFRHVLAELKEGKSPRDTGQPSAGIGAAVRIAPIGLYFADDAEALFQNAMSASLMTHRDVRSLAGALAVAIGVSRLVQLPAVKPDPAFVFRLAADVSRVENRIAAEFSARVNSLAEHRNSLSTSIANIERLLEIPRERALNALMEQGNQQGPDGGLRRATQGFAPSCIPTCLYLLLTTDSFEEALIDVINLGGDADSTGAILGALSGAVYGYSNLPADWLRGLQNREAIDVRAVALHAKSTDGLEIPELVTREFELSDLEAATRESLLKSMATGGDLGANRRL
jgi:ADP-ribosylglycohydrolase